MFGFWGYFFWAVFAFRLTVFAAWAWRKGYRGGAAGTIFLALATLGILIAGTVYRGWVY